MAELQQGKPVSLEELMVSTLAMTDALTKRLIEKAIIMDAEFKQKLLEEWAVYQRILNPTTQSLQQSLRLQRRQSRAANVRLAEWKSEIRVY